MRRLKRWWRRVIGEWRLRHRRAEIAAALAAHLKVPQVVLKLSGSRGHDSNYMVYVAGRIQGVLRLANPYRYTPNPAPDMPFVFPDTAARLTQEWQAYETAAAEGLAPKPLWRTTDAVFCAYVPLRPLQEILIQNPARCWEIIAKVTEKMHALHALGVTHMDTSLANTLGDEALSDIAFIDFEYTAAPGVSGEAQRVYDLLRLVESSWKFIPEDLRRPADIWCQALESGVTQDMRRCDVAPLRPALQRLLNQEGFQAYLGTVFNF